MFMSRLTSQVISRLDYPIVQTRYGRVRGYEKEGTFIFKGVPYAKAERFHMPEEPDPWEGVYEALAFGTQCPLYVTDFGTDQLEDPHYFMPQSENCQNLNIWTQSMDETARRPVLVWIHGGGWMTGSAYEQYSYDGEELSRRGDIVFVSVNHRLNSFGYLDLSSFGAPYENSGCAGLADLVAALRWVHENIASFGGDPENVTLAGQSGGSAKVMALLQTPAADGLYRKAIADGRWDSRLRPLKGVAPAAYTPRMGELVAQELGIEKEQIRKIETVPYYDFQEACERASVRFSEEFGVPYHYEPVPGDYFTGHPFDVSFRKETLGVPMILGGCLGEHTSNVEHPLGDGFKNTWDDETVHAFAEEIFGEDADAAEACFRETWPDRAPADMLFVDRQSRPTTIQMAKYRASCGGEVWNFVFCLESPMLGGRVAWHCSELPFLFHNALYNEASVVEGVTGRLQDQMSDAVLAFLEKGDPNHEGIPFWPKATGESLPCMLFDRESRVRTDYDDAFQEIVRRNR